MVKFLELFIDVGACCGVADICVDLALCSDADGHRFEIAMVNIGGNDAAASRHFTADQFGLKALALGDELHLFRDDTLTREMHLRHIAIAVCRSGNCFSFLDPISADSHVLPPGRRANWNYGTRGTRRQPEGCDS